MKASRYTVFDPSKSIVVAESNRLPAYDGSRLYNIKPSSMKMDISTTDVQGSITWNSGHTQVTITHSMHCYPIVTVLNGDSQIVTVDVTYSSADAFVIDFGVEMSIPQNEPWTCLMTYGCGYGDQAAAVISDGIEYVNSYPQSPELNRLYVTQTGARIYYAANAHVDFPVMNQYGFVPTTITTIPASTTEYTLYDSTMAENDHSWQYVHTPTSAPVYTLPDVADVTVEHCVILTVKFTNVVSLAFHDASGNTIAPWNTITIVQNDVVEYLCKYDQMQSKWVIFAGHLN